MNHQQLRNKFTAGALETASPAKIVVMAFDRLDRDLAGALVAIDSRDVPKAHELLVHAQDLVHELLCMLDLDAWEHAPKLASIYQYVGELLTKANMHKRTAEVHEARTLLADIGDAFRQAAVSAATAPQPAVTTAPAPAPAPAPAAAPAASRFASPSTPPPAFAGARPGSSFSAVG
jgi:flagellar protein FliS